MSQYRQAPPPAISFSSSEGNLRGMDASRSFPFVVASSCRADSVTVHYEACPNLREVVAQAREHELQVGLAFNPETAVEQAALGRLLTTWQGVVHRRHGVDALLDVVEQLQGAPVAASILESRHVPSTARHHLERVHPRTGTRERATALSRRHARGPGRGHRAATRRQRANSRGYARSAGTWAGVRSPRRNRRADVVGPCGPRPRDPCGRASRDPC